MMNRFVVAFFYIIAISLLAFALFSLWQYWNLNWYIFLSGITTNLAFPVIATIIGGVVVVRLTRIQVIKDEIETLKKILGREKGVHSYDEDENKEAVYAWEELANSGDAISQNALGYMYATGQGVALSEENDEIAVKLFRESAKGGNPMAHYNLGEMYRDGRIDGRVNNLLSYMWYYIAKENGIELAQQELDALEKDGRTPSGDKKIAIQYAKECIKSNYTKYNS